MYVSISRLICNPYNNGKSPHLHVESTPYPTVNRIFNPIHHGVHGLTVYIMSSPIGKNVITWSGWHPSARGTDGTGLLGTPIHGGGENRSDRLQGAWVSFDARGVKHPLGPSAAGGKVNYEGINTPRQ